MANKITNTQHYQDIADAIRAKNGLATLYQPGDMAQAIEDLPAQDTTLLDFMAGNCSGAVTLKGITTLKATILIFSGNCNSGVTSLTMPDLVLGTDPSFLSWYGGGIADTNFSGCNVTEIHLPVCAQLMIGNCASAYGGCFKNLEVLDTPKLEALAGSLKGNTKMKTLSLPELTQIGSETLRECTALETVDFPKLATSNQMVFYGCTALKNVNLPVLATLNQAMFQGCTSLETITLPKAIFSSSYCFQGCTNLVTCDIGGSRTGRTVGYNSFYDCTALDALVIRSTSLVALGATGSMTGTPIAAGTGYIYVPRDLISTYEAATNWSTYAGQFRAIEDYTDDGTLTGEFIHP